MNGEAAAFLCPSCGEVLDDFAPCACALAPARPPRPRQWTMRGMVARKLERQRSDKP